MNKNKLAAARIRARYLFEEMDRLFEIDDPVALIMIKEINAELDYLAKNMVNKKYNNGVTAYDIAVAREFPIEELIDFHNGKAYAWCHNDHNPSLCLNKKKNTCHCFVCNKSYDSIGVLKDRDGLSFIEAVRRLNDNR